MTCDALDHENDASAKTDSKQQLLFREYISRAGTLLFYVCRTVDEGVRGVVSRYTTMLTKRVEIKVDKDEQLEMFSHSECDLLLNYFRKQYLRLMKRTL